MQDDYPLRYGCRQWQEVTCSDKENIRVSEAVFDKKDKEHDQVVYLLFSS